MPNVTVALDAMGGDFAPHETVKAAVDAVDRFGVSVILVGPRSRLEEELLRLGRDERGGLSIQDAAQVVSMSDPPSAALRAKRDSSIRVATALVGNKSADAVVSAGNTGATMACARRELGLVKGVQRPAIAQVFPNRHGGTVVLDLGANVDCKVGYLVQFGVMGSVYAGIILGKSYPRVGLLSIGTEDTKGNEFTRQVLAAMREEPNINFVGNIEGRDVFKGAVDVVVCDGFVGNIVLKITEGVAETVLGMMKDALASSLLGRGAALLMRPAFARLKKKLDYSEYGGALLLGVNGVCVICHGGSNAKAIRNAIRVADNIVASRIVSQIAEKMERSLVKESRC